MFFFSFLFPLLFDVPVEEDYFFSTFAFATRKLGKRVASIFQLLPGFLGSKNDFIFVIFFVEYFFDFCIN